MKRGIVIAAAALFFVQSAASAPPAPPPLRLGELRLHVFNRDRGTLSPDLLTSALPTGTWNLAIGGNGLEGPADDAVLIVPVHAAQQSGSDKQVFSDAPIAITAKHAGGRVLARRTVRGVLTSQAGDAYLALWLKDVTCDDELRFEALMGRQRVTASYAFRCGE